ncbi:DUF2189 domain-containing protein [Rhizobium paknamense]|uniref:Membrane protein n=1 Tax=Rhizobium paknamense TaxID=1206817 RepID=A0ABU0I9A1_9HYPH|nr:DUF2189 domain-containing protein [Rhizobium paknamense]MDQ0454817.1 putative membrane protein [Rhizobium paknamense]
MGDQAAGSSTSEVITLRKLKASDVWRAFQLGYRDFRLYPAYGLFFGGIYGLGGLFIVYGLLLLHMPWLIIPVAIGFPLIGPFVAVGLYEISRRHEMGEEISWRAVLAQVFRQRERQLSWMAFVVLFIFWIWIYQVRLLMVLFLGSHIPASLAGFLALVIGAPQGMAFLAVGTLVGGVIAGLLFSVTVLAMPLLLDRDMDFITAMMTSLRFVAENKLPAFIFGATIALAAILAMLPAFLGLFLALPVMGHATWHLYRQAVQQG